MGHGFVLLLRIAGCARAWRMFVTSFAAATTQKLLVKGTFMFVVLHFTLCDQRGVC
jgi:hypothetical protein